jgi:1-acyl-sn-glycerol-3-phosphate acyltransferase
MGLVRASIGLAALALVSLLLAPVQWLANRLHWTIGHTIPMLWHRGLLKALHVRVHSHGAPTSDRPLLIVANHVSWLDISVVGSRTPLSFVAKAEVATWPAISVLADLARTVYVDRARRTETGKVGQAIAERLADGDAIVLFPEGTTGCGNRLLPFRTGLLGATREAILRAGADHVICQPLAICYTHAGGLPMGWAGRAIVSWPGAVELGPSVRSVIRARGIDVHLIWGHPIRSNGTTDRKQLVRELEADLINLVARGITGRPGLPEPRYASMTAAAIPAAES